ncbi:MAG: helix-hairpin-helix domain-containing protein [Bacteroidia bacterium]
MDNASILGYLNLYAKLGELHDENPFKIRAFSSAAFNLKKIKDPLADLSAEQLLALPGVGKSVVQAIREITEMGQFAALQELVQRTPEGVLSMLKIKGLGPKKAKTLWQDYGVETVEDLLDACRENRLVEWSGFGPKTQAELIKAIEFAMASTGQVHLARAYPLAQSWLAAAQAQGGRHSFTGALARHCDTLEQLDFISDCEIEPVLKQKGIEATQEETVYQWVDENGLRYRHRLVAPDQFERALFESSSEGAHLSALGYDSSKWAGSDLATYQQLGKPFIPVWQREGVGEFEYLQGTPIAYEHLRGTLHNHTHYSDGLNSLEEMAKAAERMGLEYFGVCDHSKTAAYAGGLSVERLLQQGQEVDRWNSGQPKCRIFKGIESDILLDGSLDYDSETLAQLDFVVASIHAVLKMDLDRAMQRLIRAIENPYTTILGHMTGRLLLMRSGYPVDHRKIIDACADNGVAIEINAHPYRLDMDWRYVDYAQKKGVMLSINPDAHEQSGLKDMHWGVLSAAKGGLLKEFTLNALSGAEFEAYLEKQKTKRP